jgi:hypothetical protein
VVEAGSITHAIEVLSDDPEFGYVLHVRERDLEGHPEGEREFDNKGRVIDIGKVRVHGWDRCDIPYPSAITSMDYLTRVSTHADTPSSRSTESLTDTADPDGAINWNSASCPPTENPKCKSWTNDESRHGSASEGQDPAEPPRVAVPKTATPTSRT